MADIKIIMDNGNEVYMEDPENFDEIIETIEEEKGVVFYEGLRINVRNIFEYEVV